MATQFKTTDEAFDYLGRPVGAGRPFMTLERTWVQMYGAAPELVPWPDYAHRIVRDVVTGHFLVERPDASGIYFHRPAKSFEIIRETTARAEQLHAEADSAEA